MSKDEELSAGFSILLQAANAGFLSAGEVCISTFLWKEGIQFPVGLLMSIAVIVVSGSPLSRGSDCFWGFGYLLQSLPDH